FRSPTAAAKRWSRWGIDPAPPCAEGSGHFLDRARHALQAKQEGEMLEVAPTKQALTWLNSFAAALEKRDQLAATELFLEDCYWRDLLAFTWNIKTMEGKPAIADMLAATLDTVRPKAWRLSGEANADSGTVEAWFTFETATAHGRGILRLRNGRCHTLFTTATDLKGFEEKRGRTRELGVTHKAD